MASNFRIFLHRSAGNVHLKLTGDFDGTSADELLNALKQNGAGTRKIFIHTDGLREIYPFGQRLFQNNLYVMNGRSAGLVFTGRHGTEIGRSSVDSFIS